LHQVVNNAKLSIPAPEWNKRLQQVRVTKHDLNQLVMDYLVIEGYREAAENFSRESGLQPPVELDTIEERTMIRNAICRGDIDEAINRTNELNPEVLDSNPRLFFHLQQQRLIEYIRASDIEGAITFAQTHLAPRGTENPEFLRELERTMTLLAFDNPPDDIAPLLGMGQRQKTANELNAAILASQNQGKEAKLAGLMRMLTWGEAMLDDLCEYPHVDLTTGLLGSEVAKTEDTSALEA